MIHRVMFLVAICGLSWLATVLHAATVHVDGTDSSSEVSSVFRDKTLLLNSCDVQAKLRITLLPDSGSGIMILATPQNCVTVFERDSAEALFQDGALYVRTDEVAEALHCSFQVKKKRNLNLTCPDGLPSSYVGPKVGDTAPGFRLKSDTVSTVALPDLLKHGPVVVVFFRTGEWDPFSKLLLRMLAANTDSLQDLGYQVVGIHGYEAKFGPKWQKDFEVQFPLLSDEYSTVMRTYGVFDRGHLAVPSLIVIGRDGTIRLRHIFDLSGPPDFSPILEKIREIPR
jgi:peroxiredoxin